MHRPESVDEALALLNEFGEDACPYAGGTELVMVLKLGLSSARHLVDLRRIADLQGIRLLPGGGLRIGATTTHRQVQRSALVSRWSSLAEMEATVGNIRVQATGTIGGNLCFADPQSDPATYLTAAGATLVLAGAGSAVRRLPVGEFILGAYSTSLRTGEELLGAIEVPPLDQNAVLVHRKIAFGERPDVTCAVRLTAHDSAVREVRVVFGSLTERPMVTPAPDGLCGLPVADLTGHLALIREVAAECAAQAHAMARFEARGRHARAIAATLLEELLLIAARRLAGGEVAAGRPPNPPA